MTLQIAEIQVRRATAAVWTSSNRVLAEGEYGYETDSRKRKLGDGVTAWTDLAYLPRLDSPAFTGVPTAPTPAAGDSSTKLATTAFAQGASRAAYQFRAGDYGAVGDGKMILDAAMTSGSAVLSAPSGSWTAADVGKHVMVNAAGPVPGTSGSGALFSTIQSYQSATQVTLADAATRTVAGVAVMYGTDDSAAVKSAMSAAQNYLRNQPYYAELVFDARCYILATAPVPGGDLASGITYGNAQIPLPVVDLSGTGPKRVIVIRGTSDNSTLDFWWQSAPTITGTTIFSMVEITGTNDPTYGPQAVVGGPQAAGSFTHGVNNVCVVIDGIQIVCPFNTGMIALDFWLMAQYAIKTASLDVFAGVLGTPNKNQIATNGNGQGLRTNNTGFNDRCDIDSLTIEGYYCGMSVDEHISCNRVAIIYAHFGMYISGASVSGTNQGAHGCWFGYASLEQVAYCVFVQGSAGGTLFGLVIENLDNEGAVTAHVSDPNNNLVGRVNLMPTQSQALTPPIVVGAGNLELKNVSQARGHVTAPAVPATTVALLNPFWRDVAVTVTGGGVTAITVDGTSVGQVAGTVIVPSGKTIALTYTGSPAWVWTVL